MSLSLYNFTRADLASFCSSNEFPIIHANSIFKAVYQDLPQTFRDNSRKLPIKLFQLLGQKFQNQPPEIRNFSVSRYDQSVKLLILLFDGSLVETVLMPEKNRITLCLSSQVGCSQACRFCYTGRMGLRRDLATCEIIGQFIAASRWIANNPGWRQNLTSQCRISNIVFMGMGEPLDNAAQIIRAITIFTDQHGLALALKKVSVSTAGHLDGLKTLLQIYPHIPIAISLHTGNDRLRSKIMPINKKWPLPAVLSFLRHHFQNISANRSMLVQYTLLGQVNDDSKSAHELCEQLKGLPAKVNLIPFNRFANTHFQTPSPESVNRFRDILHKKGIRTIVRYSKGQDITAACGQLANF